MYIKSPMNYIGGKYKLLESILNKFPNKIDTFVDLFAGGFNVGINVEANKIVCNDILNYVIELYKYIKSENTKELFIKIEKIIDKYKLDKENQEGYLNLRLEYNQKKDSLLFFVLICFSFNHQIRFNNNQLFNTPFGKNRSSYNNNIKKNLKNFSKALKEKDIIFSSLNFNDVDLSALTKKDLVYCDPPYLITTGSYNDGNRGFKNWGIKEEKELLKLLDRLNRNKVKFALSNVLYHKELKNEQLIEWSKKYNIYYLDKNYDNCNYQVKKSNNQTMEVLITNFKY